jgi:biopolymer transport protein ExbD
MAGISVETGGHGGRKSVNAELMLVPMIDLLMVTVAFLLVTAVWSQMSRVESSANVPGDHEAQPTDKPPPKRLHVRAKEEGRYELTWKTGSETSRTLTVDSAAESLAAKGVKSNRSEKLPALASAITKEWNTEGAHRDASDMAFDEAVVHTGNEIPYSRLVAILDAVKEPTRNVAIGGRNKETSAFAVTFAAD